LGIYGDRIIHLRKSCLLFSKLVTPYDSPKYAEGANDSIDPLAHQPTMTRQLDRAGSRENAFSSALQFGTPLFVAWIIAP
jgi:hypothetical protein